jgi:hypothetical protein
MKGINVALLAFIIGVLTTLIFSSKEESLFGIPKTLAQLFPRQLCAKGCTAEEVSLWTRNLKHELHDIDGDSVPEFFIKIDHSDWCGAGNNCDYWIYQKVGGKYKLILNDKVLRVRETDSNGYRDLASETPMGFCGERIQRLAVTLYKYDGEQYQAVSYEDECRAY